MKTYFKVFSLVRDIVHTFICVAKSNSFLFQGPFRQLLALIKICLVSQ